MPEEVTNIILEDLRVMRGDIVLIKQDLRDVTLRLGSLETNVATLVAQMAHIQGDVLRQTSRFDTLALRVDRIERRLELQP